MSSVKVMNDSRATLSQEISRTALAQAYADAEGIDLKLADSRVQQATEKRALSTIGAAHVGRGRARRYPEGSLFRIRLIGAMVSKNVPWPKIIYVLKNIEKSTWDQTKSKGLLGLEQEARAMHMALVVYDKVFPLGRKKFPAFGLQYHGGQVSLEADWGDAVMINVTRIATTGA